MKKIILTTLLVACFSTLFANNKAKIESVISLPSGHFLENLTFMNEKEIIATDYTGKALYKYTEGGKSSLWTTVSGHPVSIRFDEKGNGLLSVHQTSIMEGNHFVNSMALYSVSPKGKLELLKKLDTPAFLNGMVHVKNSLFLIADAMGGKIYSFDTKTKELVPWFEDELLKPDAKRAGLPGVNGIQIYNDTLFLTNSAQKILAKIPLKETKATSIEVIHKGIQADDFVIDSQNNWFITTHHEELIMFTKDKQVITLLDKGIEGNTAIQKSRHLKDTFYITTDGGLFFGSKSNATLSKVTF